MIRTCIGCRQRVEKTTLVRIVARSGEKCWHLEPDVTGSLPGRGAYLHPSLQCLELATRRRAFGRALRIEGTIELARIDAVIAAT